MNLKEFYEKHRNFSCRTSSEYFISPGIRCKFDLIKEVLGTKRNYTNSVDLGCSGDSILCFLDNITHKSYFDIANFPLKQYSNQQFYHPLCGDLRQLPFRNESFDFVSALDVLEHIKDDELAVSEINRILKKKGLTIITVPHRKKYYTAQDRLIGHYRRYEINQIYSLFKKYNLKNIKTFGVYGQLMRIADIQSFNPKKTEETLLKLRIRYNSNSVFRKIWDVFVKVGAKFMKLDAKYRSLKKIMNIAFVFIKE